MGLGSEGIKSVTARVPSVVAGVAAQAPSEAVCPQDGAAVSLGPVQLCGAEP